MHHFWQPQVGCCSPSAHAWQLHAGSSPMIPLLAGCLFLYRMPAARDMMGQATDLRYCAGTCSSQPFSLSMCLCAKQRPMIACVLLSWSRGLLPLRCPHICDLGLRMVHSTLLTCRVGNSVFKKAFHTLVGTSYRIIQGADPVPTLPPAFK